MTSDTSIGLDDPRRQESGLDDEDEKERRAREARKEGDAVGDEARSGTKSGDLTAEDIERGNDRNTSADDMGRSGTTNKLKDDGIDVGK